MTNTVTWAVPGRIIHWTLGEGSTVEELAEVNSTIHALLAETDAEQVHMLINISQLNLAKSVLNGAKLQNSLTYQNAPNWGYTALYGNENRALKVMIQMFSNIMGAAIRFAETREDAYAELQAVDPTLPPADTLAG